MRSKYRNKPCEYRGKRFDSLLERDRWIVLAEYEKKKIIKNLDRQFSIDLNVSGKKVCGMRIDFFYFLNGKRIYEDAKGVITPEWDLKRKIFEALTSDKINIITKDNLHSLPMGGP